MDQWMKDLIKNDLEFKRKWIQANNKGGSYRDLERLAKEHLGPDEFTRRSGKTFNTQGQYSQSTNQRTQRPNYDFDDVFKKTKNFNDQTLKDINRMQRRAGFGMAAGAAGVGLGAYAFNKWRDKQRTKQQYMGKAASESDNMVIPGIAGGAAGLAALEAPGRLAGLHAARKDRNPDFKSKKDLLRYVSKLRKANNIKERVHVQKIPNTMGSSALNPRGAKWFSRDQIRHAFSNKVARGVDKNVGTMFSGPNKAVAAHELGHLTGGGSKNKLLQMSYTPSKLTSMAGSLAAVPAAAYYGAKGEDSGASKASKYLVPALAAPMLLEEGRASGRAFNMIRKADGLKSALKSVPTLGLMGSTYAGLAAAPLIAHKVGRHFHNKNKEN